jgi:hypothetical protein
MSRNKILLASEVFSACSIMDQIGTQRSGVVMPRIESHWIKSRNAEPSPVVWRVPHPVNRRAMVERAGRDLVTKV